MDANMQYLDRPLTQAAAHFHFRRLLAWSDNPPLVDWLYVIICLLLTCMAGLMSGLTLGLLSLDTVELEVLLRSGTPSEQRYARKIMPILSNSHLLLVTLLMCNAASMEALPLFLDKLADPVTAVIVSVTAVLFFGEIIPQSVCSRYGLAIGATLAPLVRVLIWLCSPVAWPMGKLLDLLIGPDHCTLFRRRQLKELVSIHAEDAGMGGALTKDEIKVITGALDLTSKIAYRAMTPLDKVFMLSSADRLDESTLRSILRSGHSRIPVHRHGERTDVVGLVLVKELLQYRLGSSEDVPVGMLRIRSIPRLPATTRMYDMLRLFQTGRSHIAVLTQPPPGELQRLLALDPSMAARRPEMGHRSRSAGYARPEEGPDGGAGGGGAAAAASGTDGAGGAADDSGPAATVGRVSVLDDGRSVAAETEADGDGYMPYGLYYATSGGVDTSYPPSALDPQESGEAAAAVAALDGPASFRQWGMPDTPRGVELDESVGSSRGPPPPPVTGTAADFAEMRPSTLASALSTSPRARISSVFEAAPAAAIAAAAAVAAGPEEAAAADHDEAAAASSFPSPRALRPARGSPSPPRLHGGRQLSRMGLEAGGAAAAGGAQAAAGRGCSTGVTPGGTLHGASDALAALDAAALGGAEEDGTAAATPWPDHDGDGPPAAAAPPAAADPATAGGADKEYDSGEPEEGQPIGIITIEDVIEELIRSEIVDETDRYVDNNRLIRVNQAQLAQSLPEHLAKVLAAAGASKKAAALHRAMSGNFGAGGGGSAAGGLPPSRRSFASGLGLGGGSSARDLSRGSNSNHQPQQQGGALRVPLLQAEQVV